MSLPFKKKNSFLLTASIDGRNNALFYLQSWRNKKSGKDKQIRNDSENNVLPGRLRQHLSRVIIADATSETPLLPPRDFPPRAPPGHYRRIGRRKSGGECLPQKNRKRDSLWKCAGDRTFRLESVRCARENQFCRWFTQILMHSEDNHSAEIIG